VAQKSKFDLIRHGIQSDFIEVPYAVRISARLRDIMNESGGKFSVRNLAVWGESGTGKTRLIQNFVEDFLPIRHVSHTEIPVLFVQIPSKVTIKALAGEILREMGSEYWQYGDEVQKTYQLLTLLSACKVRLIILDEVNHLVDRGGVKTHYAVGDWIKQLGDKSGVSIAIFGTKSIERLLAANEQLRGRYREVIQIERFTAVDERMGDLQSLMTNYMAHFQSIDIIDLTLQSNAKLVAIATDGRLREMKNLFVGALDLIESSSSPRVDRDVLARAFQKCIYRNASERRNPFHPKFNGLPLTGHDEPYAPGAN